ncbi:hypothetical protein OIU34_08625 [Pararhizobium sp. BT-229]|uniref:hypothetical protein n=1 Tax=Pararhizobium sp. BT-229 TaxID=2986923 RepID=UPI0021F6A198|nr:hypothetical protein [Pararhizobium sp. BT-229]MCV9961965.1 hypothetical protein [Pararhizobium sp. BT-229]
MKTTPTEPAAKSPRSVWQQMPGVNFPEKPVALANRTVFDDHDVWQWFNQRLEDESQ